MEKRIEREKRKANPKEIRAITNRNKKIRRQIKI